jgi:hypothetical protein
MKFPRLYLKLRWQMAKRYKYGALVAMNDECCSIGLGSAQGIIIARRVTNAKGAEILVSFWYDKKLRAEWFCPLGIVVLHVRPPTLQESESETKNA